MKEKHLTKQQAAGIGVLSGLSFPFLLSLLYTIWRGGLSRPFDNVAELRGLACYSILAIPGAIAGAMMVNKSGGTRLAIWMGGAVGAILNFGLLYWFIVVVLFGF